MTSVSMIETARENWPEDLGHELNKAGRNFWLLSLGAAGALGEHTRGLFDRLIEHGKGLELEGTDVERQLRRQSERLRDFGQRAERRLEAGMSSTLERFGVPTKGDVRRLRERIEELARKVEGLS